MFKRPLCIILDRWFSYFPALKWLEGQETRKTKLSKEIPRKSSTVTQQVNKGGANTTVDIEDKIWLLLNNGYNHFTVSKLNCKQNSLLSNSNWII